jgi:hypothetical protein
MQEHNWIFKAESVLDLPTCQEASAGISHTTAKYLIIRSVSALVLLCCAIRRTEKQEPGILPFPSI